SVLCTDGTTPAGIPLARVWPRSVWSGRRTEWQTIATVRIPRKATRSAAQLTKTWRRTKRSSKTPTTPKRTWMPNKENEEGRSDADLDRDRTDVTPEVGDEGGSSGDVEIGIDRGPGTG